MGDSAAQKRWYEKKKLDPDWVEKQREKARARYYKNPEKYKANSLKWHAENREKALARLREYARTDPKKFERKEKAIAKGYGITVEEFRRLRETVFCEICEIEFPDTKNQHIDHDHATGKVRGVLCASCNMMLGNAKDNPDILRRAVEYLNKETTNV